MNRTLLCSAVLVGSLFALMPANAQIVYNGHTYDLTDAALSWTEAENHAVILGGHLVTINDAAEEQFLETTFLTGNFANKPLWIGFTDQAVEGTFVWSSGEPVTYTNWSPGEPNNSGGNENYTAMNWLHALNTSNPIGAWNDTPLNGTTGYGGNTDGPYFGIVEFPSAPATPEPGTFALCGAISLVGAGFLKRRRR